MRKLIAAVAVALVAAAPPAAAQEIGEEVVLSGCLASEGEDAAVSFLLNDNDPNATPARIQLFAAPELDLAPHVGHTVQVTGVVVAEPAAENEPGPDAQEDAEPEAGEAEAPMKKLHIEVAALQHVAGSCEAPKPQDGTGLPR